MACALASALVVPDAGADPEIAPDPGSIPSAVSPETPVDESTERRALKLDYSAMPTALRIVLAPPSAEEKKPAAETDSKPRVMIGYHRDVPSEFKGDLSPQFDWIEQSDESYVTSLSVTSPGAESLRVGIRAELGPDGEIRFFGEQSDERFPVITREDFPIEGDQIKTLWSPTMDGDTIGIEITLPSKKAMSVFWLTVDAVAHTFVPTHSFPSAPKLDCPSLHIDVACRSASIHGDLQNAVAHIRFEDSDSYICAGTLMNDTVPSTVVPYFLTANHCVGTGTVARTVEAWWFYQNARCGISALDSRYTRTTSGTDLLTTSSSYDQSLLRFRGSIPGGLTFSGSNPSSLNHPTGVYGIHHPDGVVKSYSAGNTDGNRTSDGVLNALHVRWSEGTTESGSSGSGLFLRNGGQLVGALSHGPRCGYRITDSYGPFSSFFPQVRCWLDPDHARPITCHDDHGNTLAEATSVGAPSSTAGNLERNGDRDYFRFVLATGGPLSVYTTGSTDTYATLTRSGSSFRLTDDDSGPGVNFRINVPDAQTGTYYVEVRGYETGTTGVYTLHVEPSGGEPGPADHAIPLVPEASNRQLQGFVRVINRSNEAGSVLITAIDDTGGNFGPITLRMRPRQRAHFNSWDLENGNPSKGLSGGVGDGMGHWRLELRTELDTEALAYIRSADGFLASIHEVAAETGSAPLRYDLPYFNPASNRSNVSWLRLINPGGTSTDVTIAGWDDDGVSAPGGSAQLILRGGAARMLSAQQLESGTAGLSGRLGDGKGKWQLSVSADHPLHVMSLMRSVSGNVTNLTR